MGLAIHVKMEWILTGISDGSFHTGTIPEELENPTALLCPFLDKDSLTREHKCDKSCPHRSENMTQRKLGVGEQAR